MEISFLTTTTAVSEFRVGERKSLLRFVSSTQMGVAESIIKLLNAYKQDGDDIITPPEWKKRYFI